MKWVTCISLCLHICLQSDPLTLLHAIERIGEIKLKLVQENKADYRHYDRNRMQHNAHKYMAVKDARSHVQIVAPLMSSVRFATQPYVIRH